MHYDFDQEIPRHGTKSHKWGAMHDEEDPIRWRPTDEFFGENRILPLWVADMDFACPKPVVEALVSWAQHGILGYTDRTSAYNEAVVNWMQKRHQWEIAPEWICTTPV